MKKITIFIITIGLILVILYRYPVKAENHPFFEKQLSKVVPHRGGLGIFPENTLFAFDQAKKLGFNILELDVRSTLDSVLIVFHDSTLNRMTGKNGQISQLEYSQIKSLRIFSDKSEKHKIPTLDELFDQIKNVNFIIEIKGREKYIPKLLCKMIEDRQLTNNVLIASFTSDQTERFREECSAVATGATINEMKMFGILNKIYMDGFYNPDFEAMILPLNWNSKRLVTNQLSSRTKDKNIKLYVWTVNDTNTINKLIQFGIAGVISDLHFLYTELQYNDS